MGSRSPTRCV